MVTAKSARPMCEGLLLDNYSIYTSESRCGSSLPGASIRSSGFHVSYTYSVVRLKVWLSCGWMLWPQALPSLASVIPHRPLGSRGKSPAHDIRVLLPSPPVSTFPTHSRNHGCRKEQEIVKGQEGLEEAHRPVRAQGLVLHQGTLHLQHPGVRPHHKYNKPDGAREAY